MITMIYFGKYYKIVNVHIARSGLKVWVTMKDRHIMLNKVVVFFFLHRKHARRKSVAAGNNAEKWLAAKNFLLFAIWLENTQDQVDMPCQAHCKQYELLIPLDKATQKSSCFANNWINKADLTFLLKTWGNFLAKEIFVQN